MAIAAAIAVMAVLIDSTVALIIHLSSTNTGQNTSYTFLAISWLDFVRGALLWAHLAPVFGWDKAAKKFTPRRKAAEAQSKKKDLGRNINASKHTWRPLQKPFFRCSGGL